MRPKPNTLTKPRKTSTAALRREDERRAKANEAIATTFTDAHVRASAARAAAARAKVSPEDLNDE
jgi:hypothetical protein